MFYRWHGGCCLHPSQEWGLLRPLVVHMWQEHSRMYTDQSIHWPNSNSFGTKLVVDAHPCTIKYRRVHVLGSYHFVQRYALTELGFPLLPAVVVMLPGQIKAIKGKDRGSKCASCGRHPPKTDCGTPANGNQGKQPHDFQQENFNH